MRNRDMRTAEGSIVRSEGLGSSNLPIPPTCTSRGIPSFSNQRIIYSGAIMKTFGTLLSEARRAKGMSQKELAAKVRKEDGQAISPQYLNDIEHERRNPPSEFLIGQMAELLGCDKDTLCLAAGTIPSDLMKMAAAHPDRVEEAFKAFRRKVKGN